MEGGAERNVYIISEEMLPLIINERRFPMAKQMLIDAYRGKRTAKAPWVPYAGVHCAFLINEPADKKAQ